MRPPNGMSGISISSITKALTELGKNYLELANVPAQLRKRHLALLCMMTSRDWVHLNLDSSRRKYLW